MIFFLILIDLWFLALVDGIGLLLEGDRLGFLNVFGEICFRYLGRLDYLFGFLCLIFLLTFVLNLL